MSGKLAALIEFTSIRYATLAVVISLVVVGCLHPDIHVPAHGVDIVIHLFVFFGVSLVVFELLDVPRTIKLIGLLLLAVTLEASQMFIPGRSAGPEDLIANISGVLCAYLIVLLFKDYKSSLVPSK